MRTNLDDVRGVAPSPGEGAEKKEVKPGGVGDYPVQPADPVHLDGKAFLRQSLFDDFGDLLGVSAEAGITDQDAHQVHSSMSAAVDRT